MAADTHSDTAFIRKLDSIYRLGEEDRQQLLRLPFQFEHIERHQDIVSAGATPSRCCMIFEGFTAWTKITAAGRRQISSFHIAGDIPDLHGLQLETLDSSLTALTRCRVGFVAHDAVLELCNREPRINSALWRSTLVDAAIFREWVTNIGSRDAFVRIGHLICEMVERLHAIGGGTFQECSLPFTQQEIADAMGLSIVHVNRGIQFLRARGLISWSGDCVRIHDWEKLKEASDFQPDFLHMI